MLTIWQKDKFRDMGYDIGTLKHRELLIETVERYFPFESILDVGCATGPDLALIEMVMPTTRRMGFDLDPKNINEAKNKINAELRQGDLREELKEIPDKSFDVVFSNGVIMYTSPKYAKEMLRIAKKGVILSERDPGQEEDRKISNYIKTLGKKIFETRITEEIRDSWKTDGYIYEIVV